MTPAVRIAFALAEHWPELDAAAMARHAAFIRAVTGALTIADEWAVVDQIVAQGDLAGARNPHAVIVGRLRQLPGHAATRSAVDVERAAERALDGPEARRLRAAANRGALLRVQVERGALTREDALVQIDWEHRSSAELLEAALAAFDGDSAVVTEPGFDIRLDGAERAGGLR